MTKRPGRFDSGREDAPASHFCPQRMMYTADKSKLPQARRAWRRFARQAAARFLVSLVGFHADLALPLAPADGEGIQARLQALTEELNDLDAWLSAAGQRRLRLLKELRAQDRAIAAAGAAVAASDAALATIQTELARLDGERNELRERQGREADSIGEHLATAYRLRGQDVLRLLLDQRSPATVERLLIYHRHLIEARVDALESYRRLGARLQRNAAALASRQAAAREARQRLVAHRRELQQNRHRRQELIATLDSDVANRVSLRQALLRDQERLRALLAELQRQTSDDLAGTGFAERKGTLPWPVEGALVSRFGQPRADGRLQWQGVLLRAEPASPIKAVYRGRVVFADWLRGFGLLTILDHGDGYMTLYGHADRLAKRLGDLVESGEVIAHAGQSGGMRASGLYFEIRQDGNAIDPLPWVVDG